MTKTTRLPACLTNPLHRRKFPESDERFINVSGKSNKGGGYKLLYQRT